MGRPQRMRTFWSQRPNVLHGGSEYAIEQVTRWTSDSAAACNVDNFGGVNLARTKSAGTTQLPCCPDSAILVPHGQYYYTLGRERPSSKAVNQTTGFGLSVAFLLYCRHIHERNHRIPEGWLDRNNLASRSTRAAWAFDESTVCMYAG